MPIRNMGTLLENIVLIEAVRRFARDHMVAPIDILNSFAMPPLSAWNENGNDYGFSETQLSELLSSQRRLTPASFQGMLRSCLQQPPQQPGTLGPNGALLCRLLTYHLQCPTRLWLNDTRNGHYGDAIPDLMEINLKAQQVLALPEPPVAETVVCNRPWPESLFLPGETSLATTLAAWEVPARARVGYLDPMRYRINDRRPDETDSSSHQQWLQLLTTKHDGPVISVHFTGHNHWKTLRPEIQRMHEDGLETWYPHSLVSSHRFYHVVCNVRSPAGAETAHGIATSLADAVSTAWQDWFRVIGRRVNCLHLEVR